MRTAEHQSHIDSNVAWNNCDECRADNERWFLSAQWPLPYQHVHEYLAYVKPLMKLIREGENSIDAQIWRRKFRKALHRRITLKIGPEVGRKHCDGYLERLKQFPRKPSRLDPIATDAAYLRRFASRGACTLQ